MEKKKQNRGAIKSKKAIKRAYVTLQHGEESSKVKVKDILELADISRATFYAHYRDIYDVVEEIENENIETLIEYLKASPRVVLIDNFRPFLNQLFGAIQKKEDYYKMIFLSKNSDSFLRKLRAVFVEYMMDDPEMLNTFRNGDEAKLFFSFIAAGTTNLLQEWYGSQHDFTYDALSHVLNVCFVSCVEKMRK